MLLNKLMPLRDVVVDEPILDPVDPVPIEETASIAPVVIGIVVAVAAIVVVTILLVRRAKKKQGK